MIFTRKQIYLVTIHSTITYHFFLWLNMRQSSVHLPLFLDVYNVVEVVTTLIVLYITSGYDPNLYVKNNYQLPRMKCIEKNYQFSIPNFQCIQLHTNPISNFFEIPFHHILSSNFVWISSHQIETLVWIWVSSHHIEILSILPWPLLGRTPNMGEWTSSLTKFMWCELPSH